MAVPMSLLENSHVDSRNEGLPANGDFESVSERDCIELYDLGM